MNEPKENRRGQKCQHCGKPLRTTKAQFFERLRQEYESFNPPEENKKKPEFSDVIINH